MDNRPAPHPADPPAAMPAPAPRRGPDAVRSPLTEERALSDILHLAGPEGAPRLLAQIGTDLGDVRHRIATAIAAKDREMLRGATHVLISVAGTIGAPGLHRAAAALNAAAHGADWDKVLRLSGPLLADLCALIDDIGARQDGMRQGGAHR